MRARTIVVVSLIVALGSGCGPSSAHPSDDAGVVHDAAPPVDAGIPDAAIASYRLQDTRSVAGSVRASSAHYQLIGTTSPGGGASSSASYQQRK